MTAPLLDRSIAVLTGAGRKIARLFAEHGATAVLADIDVDLAKSAAAEIDTVGVVCGATSQEQIRRLVTDTVRDQKDGIVGFTKAADKELAHHNVRANAIQPALIRTAMTAATPPTGSVVEVGGGRYI